MRWSFFFCGAGLLCLAAWIDNLRGPLLPAVVDLMDMDYKDASLIISLGNLVAMISTWLLMPILNKRPLKQIGIVILIYTSIVCAAALAIDSKPRILLWGALIGGCLSTLGSLANLFVQAGAEDSRRGQMMAALHSIYGLSSFFAPWLAGLVLVEPTKWPYLFVFAAPFALSLAVFIKFKIRDSIEQKDQRHQHQPITLEPLHVLAVLTLIMYVVGETLTSTWLSTYLVREQNFSIRAASAYTSGFFALMFVTRIICGLWATPNWHRIIIWASLFAALLCFSLGRIFDWPILLPGVGLVGPVFPLFVTWLGLRFPDRDRTLLLWTLSGMQAALASMNYLTGTLADLAGFSAAFWLPGIVILLTMILLKTLELRDPRRTH
jgi:fucose permease